MKITKVYEQKNNMKFIRVQTTRFFLFFAFLIVTAQSLMSGTEVDKTAPEISLISPVDNAIFRDEEEITFTCYISDDISVKSVTLFGDWGEPHATGWNASKTNLSGCNGCYYTFEMTLPAGDYTWNCYACDGAGNCKFSESNRHVSVVEKPCNLPANLSMGEVNISGSDRQVIELDKCYKAYLCKPSPSSGPSYTKCKALITDLYIWNGRAWSENLVHNDPGFTMYYGLGFLEHFDLSRKSIEGAEGWRYFWGLEDRDVNYSIVVDEPNAKIIRFYGTDGDSVLDWENIWVFRNDRNFIRGYHQKKFNKETFGTQDQFAWMYSCPAFNKPGDILLMTNEVGAGQSVRQNELYVYNMFTATDRGLMDKFPYMLYYDSTTNVNTGLIFAYTTEPKTIDWSFLSCAGSRLAETQLHFYGLSGTVRHAGEVAYADAFYSAGAGKETAGQVASKWFSPHYVTKPIENEIRAGVVNQAFRGKYTNYAGLWSPYVKVFNKGDKEWDSGTKSYAIYPLSYASKNGKGDGQPHNIEQQHLFETNVFIENSSGIYKLDDSYPVASNDEKMSCINRSLECGLDSAKVNYTLWKDSDKLQQLVSVAAKKAAKIYYQLDYDKDFSIYYYYKDTFDVVKLDDKVYDVRWHDPALGWIGSMVYSNDDVEIEDKGSSLRIYLLKDTVDHENVNANARIYVWNHEGIPASSPGGSYLTPLHSKADLTYNQHFINIFKDDPRFGILEFGESAIINEHYKSNKNLTMQFWGLKGTHQDYTFYYSTLNDISDVTVDGIETRWAYDYASKILTFSVDYADEVREIVITENTTKPFRRRGDINKL